MTKRQDDLVDALWRAEQMRRTGGSDPGPSGSEDPFLDWMVFGFVVLLILGHCSS